MPRKNPFPKREREICKRLRGFREQTKLSRVAFAEQAGLDASLLRSYEAERSQLNYNAAHKMIVAFGINPQWLATGTGQLVKRVPIPPPAEIGTRPRDLFSQVYDFSIEKGIALYKGLDLSKMPPDDARHWLWCELRTNFYEWLGLVPDERITEFAAAVEQFVQKEIEAYGYQADWKIGQRLHQLDVKESKMFPGLDPAGAPGLPEVAPELLSSEGLTLNSLKGNTSVVKSEVEKLVERVKRIAVKPGAKKELAALLDVDPPRISEWLSGKKEPGGNYTLQLLRWVELQERQGK